MTSLARIVEGKLAARAPGLAVCLPGGRCLGAPEASVQVRRADLESLAHVATGQIGSLAQDWVEGRLELHGAMRDVVRAAAQLVDRDPTAPDAAQGTAGPLAWWRGLLGSRRSLARHTCDADARQVQCHHDVSDAFYALCSTLGGSIRARTGALAGAQSAYPFKRDYIYRDDRA